MSLPLFFPRVQYVPAVPSDSAFTLDELCESALAVCGGTGAWTERLVVLRDARSPETSWIRAEPGEWGAVEIGVPSIACSVRRARWALGAMAFTSLFDQVARATVCGRFWARIESDNCSAANAWTAGTPTDFVKPGSPAVLVLQSLAQAYPDLVCIGRMATYLHALNDGVDAGVAPQHADFYAPLSSISELRFHDELSAGHMIPRRLEFSMAGFPIGIYAQNLSGLPIPYEQVTDSARTISGVRVASPQMMLSLRAGTRRPG